MIIDTHTHLYLNDFSDPDATVNRALAAGIGHMIFPNVDLTTYDAMMSLHQRFPVETSVAVGLHPTEIRDTAAADLTKTLSLLESTPEAIAIGEIGIDLYWDKTYRTQQMDAFGQQTQWAIERDLPIIIHCRDGLAEILEILHQFPIPPRAVMHSFTGNEADIEHICRVVPDIYFGINGIVTFKKSTLPATLPLIGLDRLLLETDSPYLAPTPMRGRQNESAYIVYTAAFIANEFGLTTEQLADITTANARRLFALK